MFKTKLQALCESKTTVVLLFNIIYSFRYVKVFNNFTILFKTNLKILIENNYIPKQYRINVTKIYIKFKIYYLL